jgi:hypothetical protein
MTDGGLPICFLLAIDNGVQVFCIRNARAAQPHVEIVLRVLSAPVKPLDRSQHCELQQSCHIEIGVSL